MNKIFTTLSVIFILYNTSISGQPRMHQAGLRLGYTSGIFYQVSSETADADIGYNFLLSSRRNGFQFTALRIEYKNSINAVSPDLIFGWGYGGHLGSIYSEYINFRGEKYYFYGERFCPLFGIDGFITAEYRLHEIPVNVSLNIKPFIELISPSFVRIVPWDFALSISYVF